jgi:glyoxylate/hydroxypyruvate reductase A
MKIAVCLSNNKPEPWIACLQSALPDAEIYEWVPGAPQADYAMVWTPPQQFIDEQPQLKVLFNAGAGVDALLRMRIPPSMALVRLDDAGMAVQMAEYVVHALTRHFREFQAYAQAQEASQWAFRKPHRRQDFPVGILGLGVLGARVAEIVRQFEYPVNGWSRTPKALAGIRCFAGAQGLPDFLAASRVLVCLLPLTPDTMDVLNQRTLSQLQPGGYVINVARGAHLVDDDLIRLLDQGHLAGATLDVFRTEPLPPAHAFWRHPAITVTPHISARTLREESVAQVASKITALQRGEPLASLAGLVDPKKGY